MFTRYFGINYQVCNSNNNDAIIITADCFGYICKEKRVIYFPCFTDEYKTEALRVFMYM